jgi:hypothetical protein
MIVMMVRVITRVARMIPKQMNVAMAAFNLTNKVKNSQGDQSATGQKREGVADSAINHHAAPRH